MLKPWLKQTEFLLSRDLFATYLSWHNKARFCFVLSTMIKKTQRLSVLSYFKDVSNAVTMYHKLREREIVKDSTRLQQ